MNWIVLIFSSIYLLSVGTVVFVGYWRHRSKSKNFGDGTTIDPKEITVLIPFRDEEQRLGGLLKSIRSLKSFPAKFVFIDDHSTDGSANLIQSELNADIFELLSLPPDVTGKKKALRFALEKCRTTYVLTLDADVRFASNYFEEISKLGDADMYLFPAILVAESPVEYLYEVDIVLANAMNTGLSGISRPIFASGANLLYRMDVFRDVDDLATHAHMASGDDTYLLRDFRKNQKEVRLSSDEKHAIYTETPKSFREFIDQRLRWVGKTRDVGDHLSTTAAVGQFILALAFFGLLIAFGIQQKWMEFTVFFASKIVVDMVLFAPYFFRIKRTITWLTIPIYEVFFPFYSLLIFILMLTYQPKWKGRSIQSNNSVPFSSK